jgi:hypothetical protein
MFKGIIILLLGCILTGTSVIAQNESFLGLSLGAAIPQGIYAEKDFYNPQAGYAQTGFLFSFDGAIFPDDYLGIGASVTYGSNNPDKIQYKDDFYNDLQSRYPDEDLEQFEETFFFDFGVWRYLNFHVGPAFTFPAGRFNFDLKAVAGLSLAWAPQQEFQINLSEDEVFSRKVEDKATATLGYTVGTGIRFALTKGYVLRIIAEFTNCKPTMDISEIVASDAGEEIEVVESTVEMPIKNYHIGVGIAYNFEL